MKVSGPREKLLAQLDPSAFVADIELIRMLEKAFRSRTMRGGRSSLSPR